jgi:hypothetical protein
MPVDGLSLSDSSESRLVVVGTRAHQGRVGAGNGVPLAMLRVQARACPLSVMAGSSRCD